MNHIFYLKVTIEEKYIFREIYKMVKIQFSLFLIWILANGTSCEKNLKEKIKPQIEKPWQERVFELRRFFTFSSDRKGNLFKQADEIFQTFQKKIREQENARKRFQEEEKRRKIYEKYLLEYQRGSNVLRDFYTNRF